jgi:ADP-ribosyl-[dinitrogen reductase] hydrolase
LLGLAVGDALGTTLEFCRRDSSPLLTDMIGGGPFRLKPGQWTDDSAMALALADSLIESDDLDESDLMQRFVDWHEQGRYSCTGTCFDIGITTRAALARWKASGDPLAGSTAPDSAGNGSLMRIAPIPIVFGRKGVVAWREGEKSSRTTHTNDECVWSCGFFSALAGMAIGGSSKESLLAFTRHHYGPMLDNFEGKTRDEIKTTGYVRHTLEASLWAFFGTNTFEDGLVLIVNMGGDADTVGAVFGTLAGAHYGEEAIPARWRSALLKSEMTEAIFGDLWAVARQNWGV